MTAEGRTDIGKQRELNEDSFLLRPNLCLWAVSDGMGGHDGGDLASQTVVEHLKQVEIVDDPRILLDDILHKLQEANTVLRAEAAQRGGGTIGATVVCLVAMRDRALVIWAGDSRAYRLRAGKLSQISRDHSLVQEMVEAGILSAEDAGSHPHSHVLKRAVGADDLLEIDIEQTHVEPGDRFILCSDGLTGTVTDDTIALIAASEDGAAPICEALIAQALAGDASDNITVVTVMAAAS